MSDEVCWLGLQSTHFKHKIGHWEHWSVSKHVRERMYYSTHTATTPASYHLCGALEKLIRLLILVAIWVRWSHKGIHILRINKEEWQTAKLFQKNLHRPKLHTARGQQSRHSQGERWQMRGPSPLGQPQPSHSTLRFHGNWLELCSTVGEGGEGIKIPSSRDLSKGGGVEVEVMVCGDDTICLLAGLSCQSDPESDTGARG